jgi:uncharacterized protein (TIGR02145 family)
MKKQVYLLASALILLLSATKLMAQSKVKDGSITPSSSLPNANAVMELESNKRGLLLPRIALQGSSLASPLSAHVAGMVVYNTATISDVSPGYYYNDGTKWRKMAYVTPPPSGGGTGTDLTNGNGIIVTGGTGATLTAASLRLDSNAVARFVKQSPVKDSLAVSMSQSPIRDSLLSIVNNNGAVIKRFANEAAASAAIPAPKSGDLIFDESCNCLKYFKDTIWRDPSNNIKIFWDTDEADAYFGSDKKHGDMFFSESTGLINTWYLYFGTFGVWSAPEIDNRSIYTADADIASWRTVGVRDNALEFRSITPADSDFHLFGLYGNRGEVTVGTKLWTLLPWDTSAILRIDSRTKGFLPPRMTTTERNAIRDPAWGLTIFNVTTKCTEVFNGEGWWNECNRTVSGRTVTGNPSSNGTAVIVWTAGGCNVGAGPDNVPAGTRRAAVNETMVQGVNSTATVSLTANFTTGGSYNIATNTVNGISFVGVNSVSSPWPVTVTLRAVGTPLSAGNFKWSTNTIPSIDIYGSVLTTSAPLGSYYDAHFNGCDSASGTMHSVAQPFMAASYTAGQVFSENTACANKPISAQGCGGISSVTASSGRVHSTVNINGQCWLTSNLISKPSVYSTYTTASWNASSPGDQGYWGYYNTSTTSGTAGWGSTEPATNEGMLYQWCAAMNGSTSERSRGACPAGFHVPSDCEWQYLEHGLGMSIAQQNLVGPTRASSIDQEGTPGYKMRSEGTGFTNVSGFSARLSGDRKDSGIFQLRSSCSRFQTSTLASTTAIVRTFCDAGRGVASQVVSNTWGFSVRCLKD